MEFPKYVSDFRKTHSLTLASLVSGLNTFLPKGEQYSLMAACHWERGNYRPPITRMDYIARQSPEGSWQHEFTTQVIDLLTDKGTVGAGTGLEPRPAPAEV